MPREAWLRLSLKVGLHSVSVWGLGSGRAWKGLASSTLGSFTAVPDFYGEDLVRCNPYKP